MAHKFVALIGSTSQNWISFGKICVCYVCGQIHKVTKVHNFCMFMEHNTFVYIAHERAAKTNIRRLIVQKKKRHFHNEYCIYVRFVYVLLCASIFQHFDDFRIAFLFALASNVHPFSSPLLTSTVSLRNSASTTCSLPWARNVQWCLSIISSLIDIDPIAT